MKKNARLGRNHATYFAKRDFGLETRRLTVALCLFTVSGVIGNSDSGYAQSSHGVRTSYAAPVVRELAQAPSPVFIEDEEQTTHETQFNVLPDYPESQVRNYARTPSRQRYAQESVQQTNERAGNDAGAGAGETLEQAIQIAVEQSRTQRALALKRGASQSTVTAVRTLRNPKINNTTAYTGLLNQPRAKTDVDISGTLGTIAGMLPEEVVSVVETLFPEIPTEIQATTPLVDRNFVTTVTSVTVPIYLGGRVEALAQEAEALTQAVAAGEEVDLQKVKLEATEAFFLVLRTRSLHQVAIEAVEAAQSHLDDATRMEKVGILTKNVALAAQVAFSEAKQMELRVATAQSIAETAYNRVLWRPLDAPVALLDQEPDSLLNDVDALISAAIANRGELKALGAESRALQAQVNVARADVLPQVAAVGAYSYFENSHMTANSNATAAIGVTWTPFDGGTSRARQQAARQNAMAVARMREEAESGIRMQVRQAWLLQKEAHERVEIAKIAVEQAQENYRVVTRGFQEGTLNHTEALDASTRLTAAKSSYANAKYDAILATERLKSAVGSL